MENPSLKMIFDLHIHSKYSYDSLMSPRKIVELARKNGLSCIAITDHDTIAGSIEAKKYEDQNLKVLIGEEITTDHGDLIAINISKEIHEKDFFEAIEEIKRQNGISILPHPYKGHKNVEIIAQYVDYIEVQNSRTTFESNQKAKNLALKLNKPCIAGSDAHLYREIGNVKNSGKLFGDKNETILFQQGSCYPIYVSQLIKGFKKRKLKIIFTNIFLIIKYSLISTIRNVVPFGYYISRSFYFFIFFKMSIKKYPQVNPDILFSSFLVSWRKYMHIDGQSYESDLMIGDVIECCKKLFGVTCIDTDSVRLFRSRKQSYKKFRKSNDWICIEQFFDFSILVKSLIISLKLSFGYFIEKYNHLTYYLDLMEKHPNFSIILNLIISQKIIDEMKPKIIFLTCEYCGYHRELTYIAHLNKIPVIALQHGVITETHSSYIYTNTLIKNILPDITCVFGPHDYELLTKKSIYEPNMVAVTGQPRYDLLYYVDKNYNKNKFLKKYNIIKNHKIILWTTQCHALNDEENSKNVKAIFKTFQNLDNLTLIIKQHPGEGKKYTKMIQDALDNYKLHVIIPPKNSDTYEQLYVSDILITRHSTTAMEAVALNKPVIVLNLSGEPDVVDYVKEGVALGVYEENNLEPAIKKLLNGDSELAKNREEYIKKYLYKIDGKSTERVVQLIEQMLKESHVQNI